MKLAFNWVKYFLSHLCGEEEVERITSPLVIFLSHLCGEEGADPEARQFGNFLSHLCGEEEGFAF